MEGVLFQSGLLVVTGAERWGISSTSIHISSGCEIRIFLHWPLDQYISKTHWPGIDFTGPKYLYPQRNLCIASYILPIGATIEGNRSENGLISENKIVLYYSHFSFSNSYWPHGPVDSTKPLAQCQIHWPRALGQWLISQTVSL